MNIGEKVSLYKEKLKLNNYQDFGRVAGVSGSWLNELSKKTEVKLIDMGQLVKLCDYLGISVDQLVKDEGEQLNIPIETGIAYISECDDIGIILSELVTLLDRDNIKLDGMLLNSDAKQICKDSFDVVKILAKQYL